MPNTNAPQLDNYVSRVRDGDREAFRGVVDVCLPAVRSIVVSHSLPKLINEYSAYTDRANAALIMDLKQRGMLDDTLVIWGGEFGRTVFCQGKLTDTNFGREHHHLGFTMWMAGGGVKPGISYGKTDDWSFRAIENPVPVHNLNATILHLLGINHKHLTYRLQGRDFRLTDLEGNVVKKIIA